MPTRHAIVIAVDGLRASALGAYGNAGCPTPAFDRLASESLLFDWMFVDSPELADFYRAAWCGVPNAAASVEGNMPSESAAVALPRLLTQAGVASSLTTDDAWVAEQADRLGFAEVRNIEFPAPASADSIADTELAQLFAIAAEQIESWDAADSKLLWIHARGYRGAWDAPLELRESLLDEDDPAPLASPEPPTRVATNDDDELLLYRASYAAQTLVLDECLAMLQQVLESAGVADSTLVVLVGCRGFALGEHGAVGYDVFDLYGELIHVPLIVKSPHVAPAPPRSPDFIQPTDLLPSLLEWFEVVMAEPPGQSLFSAEVRHDSAPPRESVIVTHGDRQTTLRTKEWLLRVSGAAGGMAPNWQERVELFSKPDDRWEANEIADRCSEEVAGLLATLAAVRGASPRHSERSEESGTTLETLDPSLRSG